MLEWCFEKKDLKAASILLDHLNGEKLDGPYKWDALLLELYLLPSPASENGTEEGLDRKIANAFEGQLDDDGFNLLSAAVRAFHNMLMLAE